MYKKALRKKYKQLRAEISPELRPNAENTITQRLTQLSAFKECDVLFAFISAKGEISTEGIIKRAFELNKRVAAPLVLNKEEMCFIYISSFSQLREGSFGIREPEYNPKRLALPTERSVMLVPGLAFDKALNRLGYGGGYYDRYMSEHPSALKIGIGYDVQYSEALLPRDKYDIPLDILITENITIGA